MSVATDWIEAEFKDYGIVYLNNVYQEQLNALFYTQEEFGATFQCQDLFGQLHVLRPHTFIGYRITSVEIEKSMAEFRYGIAQLEERRKHNMEFFQKEKG